MITQRSRSVGQLDPVLIGTAGVLLFAGLILLTSASITVGERSAGQPFFYLQQQLFAVAVGLAVSWGVLKLPTDTWERLGPLLAVGSIGLLLLVLIPGLGHTVNGSTRWLAVGGVSVLQVSEPARLLMLMYLAGYAVRRRSELSASLQGFLMPMLLVALTCLLLMLEPDFGGTVVMLLIAMAILFVAGARIRHFALLIGLVASALIALTLASPYRMARVTGFLDPWADPFDSGFQLTQSLIAIGSGGLFGVGLGASVQKLFYLPEAHTDFVFAVFAEEFGLFGSAILIALFSFLVWRILRVARDAAERDRYYQAYMGFGIAVWIGCQALINIGVNMGVLPTKGLTLPLISYGRSSLVVMLIALALVLRIDYENRMPRPAARGARS